MKATPSSKIFETLLEQMIAQGEKVFHTSLCVLLRSKDLGDLENQVSQTLMAFRDLCGAEGMEESLASFEIFNSISIPNARCTERLKKIKTSTLADFLPIYGPWVGHPKPSILLRSRMGSLFSLDVFDPGLSNANQLVSGSSGSGKVTSLISYFCRCSKKTPRSFYRHWGLI